MPANGVDPLWIDYPRSEHAVGFFAEIADLGSCRVLSIAEVGTRVASSQRADGGDHTTVELHVVVRVEYVVLAIVLILERDLNPG